MLTTQEQQQQEQQPTAVRTGPAESATAVVADVSELCRLLLASPLRQQCQQPEQQQQPQQREQQQQQPQEQQQQPQKQQQQEQWKQQKLQQLQHTPALSDGTLLESPVLQVCVRRRAFSLLQDVGCTHIASIPSSLNS